MPKFRHVLPYFPSGEDIQPVPHDFTDLEFGTVLMTPTWAKSILDAGHVNRKATKSNVNRLARAMAHGAQIDSVHGNALVATNWQVNGQSIIFTKSGIRDDGMHRLMACVQSGVAFYTTIVLGVADKPEVLLSLDNGRARSVGDHLDLLGERDGKGVAAAINALQIYIHQIAGKRNGSSPAAAGGSQGLTLMEMKAFNERHPDLRRSVEKVGPGFKAAPSSAMAAVHYLVATVAMRPTIADEFVELLRSGAGLAEDSPILKYREAVLTSKTIHTFAGKFWALIEAYNRWALKQTGKGLVGASVRKGIGRPRHLLGVDPEQVDVARPNLIRQAEAA